jgi:hypothetical protein
VDSTVQKICSVGKVASELSTIRRSGVTSLTGPINSLLETYSQVLVLTDADGHQDLSKNLKVPMRTEPVLPGLWRVEIRSDRAIQS